MNEHKRDVLQGELHDDFIHQHKEPHTTQHKSGFINFAGFAFDLLVIIALSLAFYLSTPIMPPKTIMIEKGIEKDKLLESIENEHTLSFVVIDKTLFSLLSPLRYGEVRFNPKKIYTRADFLLQLTKAKVPLYRITLIPGMNKEQFFDHIADTLEVNATKLHQFYNKHALYKEGAILADTYLAPKGMDEESLILFLLKQSQKRFEKLSKEYFSDFNQSRWQRIITVASIIQKEAANKEEMPIIASVIYNRLKKKMKLQMDGTLNYGRFSHTKVTPNRIKEDNSPFNTYKHHGLPPYPVGSVEIAAIKAALDPAKTDYLYFVRDKKQGGHIFTKSYKEHLEAIRQSNRSEQSLRQRKSK